MPKIFKSCDNPPRENIVVNCKIDRIVEFLRRELDSNSDGIFDDNDERAVINIVGYSWGGMSTIQALNRLQKEEPNLVRRTRKNDLLINIGILDGIATKRQWSVSTPDFVNYSLNIYQRYGLEPEFAGWPSYAVPNAAFKGFDLEGATFSINATRYREGRNLNPFTWVDKKEIPDKTFGHLAIQYETFFYAQAIAGVLGL